MTTATVAALVLPTRDTSGLSESRSRRPVPAGFRKIPMPALPPARELQSVYGFAVLNDRGRIAARSVIEALGWQPGTLVTFCEAAGLVVVIADSAGTSRVTGDQHLRVPAALRYWCGLASGSCVLLVADPNECRLVIYPPAALDAMITKAHASASGGDLS